MARILCLDDEARVLSGIENHLCLDHDVELFTRGADALARLQEEGGEAFDVIISDMRMPEMDGATFLRKARAAHPDVARVLLTGQADLDSAASAVNDGAVYRFLQKPCKHDVLLRTVEEGAQFTATNRGERELLYGTLGGVIELLRDVLELASPNAFGSARGMPELVEAVAADVGVEVDWDLVAAARLLHIGSVALPDDDAGTAANSEAEQARYRIMLEASARLIENIPRLAGAAKLIRASAAPADCTDDAEKKSAALLAGATRVVDRTGAGLSTDDALVGVEKWLWDSIRSHVEANATDMLEQTKPLKGLRPGMVLLDAVKTEAGQIVVPGDTLITEALLVRLWTFAENRKLPESYRVRMLS